VAFLSFQFYLQAKQTKAHSCFHYSSLSSNLLSAYVREDVLEEALTLANANAANAADTDAGGNVGGDVDVHEKAHHTYLRYPHEAIFSKIGAHTPVWETDPSGTFVGSSFLWATVRDWARIGQLYLQDGVWHKPTSRESESSSAAAASESVRILPKGWVRFTATPAATSNGVYGGHWVRLAAND
jgi:CubicO group peptidase (beta-lactamase class C family)